MLNRVTTAVLVLELIVIAVAFRFVAWTPWKAVGGVTILAAMLLLIVARRQLGDAFSVRAKAHHLVTTGLYSRLRHPIYLAGFLLLAGAALLFQSWLPLLLAVILLPVQRARARREERVLQARFGDEHVRWRRRTWF